MERRRGEPARRRRAIADHDSELTPSGSEVEVRLAAEARLDELETSELTTPVTLLVEAFGVGVGAALAAVGAVGVVALPIMDGLTSESVGLMILSLAFSAAGTFWLRRSLAALRSSIVMVRTRIELEEAIADGDHARMAEIAERSAEPPEPRPIGAEDWGILREEARRWLTEPGLGGRIASLVTGVAVVVLTIILMNVIAPWILIPLAAPVALWAFWRERKVEKQFEDFDAVVGGAAELPPAAVDDDDAEEREGRAGRAVPRDPIDA